MRLGALILPILGVILPATALAQDFASLIQTHALTASDERKVGELTFQMSTGALPTVDDPGMVARVETVLRRVIRASDRPGQVVQLRLIDDPSINAAAYPGGYLLVHRGAVDAFDADELAFVLAHELAHVQLRHYANGDNLSRALSELTEVERARQGHFVAADQDKLFEVRKLLASYGRQLEFEADLYGLLFLVRAGRPAEKAIAAMQKLAALEEGRVATVLDGHPTAVQRQSDLRKGIESLKKTHVRFEQGVAALHAGRTDDAIPAFEDFLAVFPQSTAAWTNLALAHHSKVVAETQDPWFERMPLREHSGVTVRGSVSSGRAYDAASRALSVDPGNADALMILASLARLSGFHEHASTLIDRAEASGLDPRSVAVNRAVLQADSEQALRAWEALGDEPYAIANRAVWYTKKGQPQLAATLYRQLEDTPLERPASHALVALGHPPLKADPPPTLGMVAIGAPVDALFDAYGQPGVHQEGDLDAFLLWPERGLSAYVYADRVERLLCATRCTLEINGVGVGAKAEQVAAALGPGFREQLLYGGERWTFAEHGLAVLIDPQGVMSLEQSGVRR